MLRAYHEQELVQHARADLRQKLTGNRRALIETTAQQKAAIAVLDEYLVYSKIIWPGERRGRRPTRRQISTSVPCGAAGWEATVATRVLAHMPYAEAQRLARAPIGVTASTTTTRTRPFGSPSVRDQQGL
jgi:hypothetical protein